MADRLDLEDAITTAEGEAAVHDLVEVALFGPSAADPASFGIKAPDGHVVVIMTVGQKTGLVDCGIRLRNAVEAVSRAFYATDGAKDGPRHG